MTQTAIETSPAVKYAILITLSWGDANVARYCKWDSDLTVDAQTFTAEPTLRVSMDKPQHGGTDDSAIEIQASPMISPLDQLVVPRPHAAVSVTVEEVVPGDDTSRQTLFVGTISKASAKPRRRGGLATFKVISAKARLQAVLGVPAVSTCVWVFGDSHCGFDLPAATLTGTITEMDSGGVPNRIKIDFDTLPEADVRKWRRGYVEYDGLRIAIRELYIADIDVGTPVPIRLDLASFPPASWDDAEVSIVPGCDKQIGTCRFHERESRFGGFGIAMPNKNPLFEV